MKAHKTACLMLMTAFLGVAMQPQGAGAQTASPASSNQVPDDMATSVPGGYAPVAPSASAYDAATADYRLGVDDRITLTVFGEPDLSKDFLIAPNGSIEVPLIGNVAVAGRTADDVRAEIAGRLANGYLRNPSVTVAIATFRPFFILGEVNKPGQYPFRKGMTVMGAVATAEGYTYRAQKKWIIIKHEAQADEEKVQVTPDLLVRPGDTIRVAERYF